MSVALKPECLFRPMHADDLNVVMQIEPTIYSHPWTRGNFNDSLQAGHEAWVMLHHDKVVGYAVMMVVLDEANLLNISVAAPYQKQGLGRLLFAHLLEHAKALNIRNMFLEVRESNVAAIALYNREGFKETSVRRGYYPTNEGREDAVLMGLVL